MNHQIDIDIVRTDKRNFKRHVDVLNRTNRTWLIFNDDTIFEEKCFCHLWQNSSRYNTICNKCSIFVTVIHGFRKRRNVRKPTNLWYWFDQFCSVLVRKVERFAPWRSWYFQYPYCQTPMLEYFCFDVSEIGTSWNYSKMTQRKKWEHTLPRDRHRTEN